LANNTKLKKNCLKPKKGKYLLEAGDIS
jgi:hypothetical protein